MAMTRPKSSQVEHRGETVQKVIDDITQQDGVLNADASWTDIPKLKGANANKQAQALANRTELITISPLQYEQYADILDAAPKLAVGQIVESLYDQMCYTIGEDHLPSDERPIVKENDYSKIHSYTGRGTRLRVIDNTGAHWWVRKGSAAENGGTVLKDASGRSWVREYSGPVNVRWFGAIGDGASHPVSEYFPDLASAKAIYPIVNSLSDEIDWVGMQTAINNSGAVLASDGEYVVNRCVFVDSTEFYGSNGQRPAPNRVAIRGTAAMPINDPVIGLGRSPIVHGFRVGYQTNAITYYETEGQRKAIGPVTSSVDGAVPQRGTSVYGICIDVCGTGIGNVGTNKTIFSTTWDAIEIRRCSYSMIDLQRYGTGNIWGNVYANPLEYHNGLFKPKYGVKLQNCVNDTFIQLNLEHCVFTEAALHVVDHHNLNISSLHIEGIDVAASGGKFIYSSSSAVSINSLTVINCGMSYDNVALVELGSAEMYETTRPSDFRDKTRRSSFCVDKAWFLGLATPNPTHYPDYPFSTRGAIHKIPGFKFFRREALYLDKDYRLEVNTVNSASYVGTTGEGVVYRYADTNMYSDVNRIDVLRYSGRGRIVHPGKNHILNSAFREWVNTSASSNGTDVECAKDWWVRSPVGYTLRAQKLIDSVGSASPYFMRVSNTGTAGGNQRLTTQIRPGSELVGKDICLSFEARTTNSARWIHQIYCVFFTGGSPASVYKQIVFGTSSELAFSNTWREYRIPSFVIPKDAIASIGDGAYLELTFEVSGTTVVDTQFDIRNVKLEPGSEWTSFSE